MDTNNIKGKKAQSRRKIMHAAKTLFEEKGVSDVTFADIANEAGMCRTTVFNHFSSMNILMGELFKQEVLDIKTHCEERKVFGKAYIRELFNKLIEDTCYYPSLAYAIAESAMLMGEEKESLLWIEDSIDCALCSLDEDGTKSIKCQTPKVIAITGAYYGIIKHYRLRGKAFDAVAMKKEFNEALNYIIGE